MLSNDLLLKFSRLKFEERAKKTLQLAFFDYDIVSFLNNNQIELPPIERITAFCALGLIKFALQSDVHILGEQTLSSAIGKYQNNNKNLYKNKSTGFIRFENWLKSDSIFEFYDKSIVMIRLLKVKKLKINALTLVDSVYLKQQMLDGLNSFVHPLDRFPVRECMNLQVSFPWFGEITPELILKCRNVANLTQKECADLVYVDERTWQRWESGERRMARNIFELFLIKIGYTKYPLTNSKLEFNNCDRVNRMLP